MLDRILIFIKKLIPKKLFATLQPAYHFALGWLASVWHGRPSEKMIVVGVTGTTGKTTTIYLLQNILQSAGWKTGSISTAMFSDGEKEWMNDKKMTMLGRFFTQRLLRRMVENKCSVAIIETTSQGVVQFRHRFINYDVLLFTGLYPEHVEAHGGFENYKQAKGKLFAHLKNCRKKKINGKDITKTIIVNADDDYADYFLSFWAEKKMGFSSCHPERSEGSRFNIACTNSAGFLAKLGMTELVKARDINLNTKGLQFMINNLQFDTNLLGDFNVVNSLGAISAAKSLDVPMGKIKEGLEKITSIPGRLEKINEGQKFTVIVDYAFEPNAVTKLYETIKNIPHDKIIHVLGSTGGGRDRARRPKLGKLAGEKADYVIITNEDPYDEDPMDIINEVASGAVGKKENINLWKVLDRREAIKKALELAQEKDVVLITGKGNEQAMCMADGRKIPWDDRAVVREELKKLR